MYCEYYIVVCVFHRVVFTYLESNLERIYNCNVHVFVVDR